MEHPLARALRDAATTREVVVQADALARLPAVARQCTGVGRFVVVGDDTTLQVAGRAAHAWLQGEGLAAAAPIAWTSQPRLKPLATHARALAAHLREQDIVPVAVGSGVVNDLVKYAAELAGKPYLCVATAASMDGYAASGAALLQDGFKRTLACAPPVAVLADPGVLAQAPQRMTGWGYGDLAGKVVAGADWMLADALGVEPINAPAFRLVQDHLGGWLGSPAQLAQGDRTALAGLLSGLLVSGFAMQAHGNSRPASGSDHQFSHLWEMEGLQVGGESAAHGACVGVGCVAMLALYDWLLARPAESFDAIAVADYDDGAQLQAEIEAGLGRGEVAASARAEMASKRAIGSRVARVQRFQQEWPALREQLAARLLSPQEMQRRLVVLGAPAHPAHLGLHVNRLAVDYRRARLIRRRYTLLDLLEDIGWLDRAIADVCGPVGFWARHPAVMVNGPEAGSLLEEIR